MTTLTDLSQLTRSMVRKPVDEPKPAPNSHVASRGDPAKDRVAELEAALNAIALEKALVDKRIADLERRLAAEREEREATARERNRLQGECGRLKGELQKIADKGAVTDSAQTAPVVRAEPQKPTGMLLAANDEIIEAFPGEVREHVLATLKDAQSKAETSGYKRRADVLAGVLMAKANQPTGELERHREELKKILTTAGHSIDPKPLEKLGFRLISGRKHWKLQYANVRIIMSKTPSDNRTNSNTASDTVNRCF